MLDIANGFIKSGVGWGKTRDRRMEIEKWKKVSNKSSKKSLHNVTSPPPKPSGAEFLHIVQSRAWNKLFYDILNLLPITLKTT